MFEFDEQVTTNYLLQNGFNVIQTGIGDILLFLLLIEHRKINGPFYFNIRIYIDNPYKVNNCLNSFSFEFIRKNI